jgi:type II secretory pathway component PulJ
MGTPVLVGCIAAVLLVLAALLVVLLRSRAESRRELALAVAETAELRRRLDALSEQLQRAADTDRERAGESAYVITDAGQARPGHNVPDRMVLSASIGEPLVKAVSFGHGLRRAMSAESRNRIWFEVRREVRRARKQRRRETRQAWRRMQAEERTAA